MRTFLIAALFAIVPSIGPASAADGCGPVAIVRLAAPASSMAGVPAPACGTSALPGLNPALPVASGTSGAGVSEHVSRRTEALLSPGTSNWNRRNRATVAALSRDWV
jgi:hypothetical protein